MPFKRCLCAVLLAAITSLAAVAARAAYPSPAQSLGVAVYPKNNQSADKQSADESACFTAAEQRTGINLAAATPTPAPAQTHSAGGLKGAAGGAALGAAIGAIGGNAGAGAGAGAVAGGVRGRRSQRVANEHATQQAQAQSQNAQAQRVATVRRSFEACMDSKGYSVK